MQADNHVCVIRIDHAGDSGRNSQSSWNMDWEEEISRQGPMG